MSTGIIIGVGNIGPSLSNRYIDLKTFISTNGGMSWSQILDFPAKTELLNQERGVLVAADSY
jgi:hypothetical protein